MKVLTLVSALVLMTTPVFAQDTIILTEEYVNMPEVQNMVTSMFSAQTMGALAPEMQGLQAKIGPEIINIMQEKE